MSEVVVLLRQRTKILGCMLVCVLPVLLNGCTSMSVTNVTNEVYKYNALVKGTIDSYSESVAYSKKNKDSIIKDLTSDRGLSLNDRYKLDRLTSEQIKSFEYPMVNMDEYFTSIGASATREVILLVGSNKMVMNIILIWSGDDLLSIERRVTIND